MPLGTRRLVSDEVDMIGGVMIGFWFSGISAQRHRIFE
jgi:hypothetical protein